MCTYGFFSRHIFFASFCRFSIFVLLLFSVIFSTPSRKWRPTLFVLELRHLFLCSSRHSIKEISKLLRKSERWVNWSGQKYKTLEDKPNCVKNVIEKAVSICVMIQQDRKIKKFNFTVGTLRYPGRRGKENGESLERGRRHLRWKNKLRLSRLGGVLAWRERIK